MFVPILVHITLWSVSGSSSRLIHPHKELDQIAYLNGYIDGYKRAHHQQNYLSRQSAVAIHAESDDYNYYEMDMDPWSVAGWKTNSKGGEYRMWTNQNYDDKKYHISEYRSGDIHATLKSGGKNQFYGNTNGIFKDTAPESEKAHLKDLYGSFWEEKGFPLGIKQNYMSSDEKAKDHVYADVVEQMVQKAVKRAKALANKGK